MIDKSDIFKATEHIPTLKTLADQVCFAVPVDPACGILHNTLQADCFQLLMRTLKFEVQTHKTWLKKCSGVDNSNFWARQAFKVALKEAARDAVNKYVGSVVKLHVFDSAEKTIAAIMQFKREHIQPRLGDLGPDDVPQLPIVNWAAPCMLQKGFQAGQTQILTWALNENMKGVAVVVAPVFSYTRGKLILEETKMVNLLQQGHHNLDYNFQILFKEQKDTRDERPMGYNCRLVFPSPIGHPKKSPFFSCKLRQLGRTHEINQMDTKFMKCVEDMSEDALPQSSDARDSYVHGTGKYSQIGQGGYSEILHGLVDGAQLEGLKGLLFIDTHVKVAECLMSFLLKRATIDTRSFYFGICESQVEYDFVLNQTLHDLIQQFMNGDLQLPGVGKLGTEFDESKLEPKPTPPALTKLVIDSEDSSKLMPPLTW